MTENGDDILVDIPDEDLPKLAEMYEKHKDWAPHVYSTITTAIEWRKKSSTKYTTCMSPNSCWKEDGTFFVLMEQYAFDIFIFTLEETGQSVYEALMNTRRLETTYSDRMRFFYCLDIKLHPIVLKFAEEKKLQIVDSIPCYTVSVDRDVALQFNVECPPDVYIKELDTTHVSILNEVWPHRYKGSHNFVSLLIELNGGYGVFLKSNDELVSWVTISMLGQLALLQTKEAHKKKGYAGLMTRYMSKKLAEKGHNAFGTIVVGNSPSLRLFEKNNFKILGKATYTFFN